LNNLNNIDKIRTKKSNFFILPWFNVDNPIIMFKYNKNKKSIPFEEIKNYIINFHNIRTKNIIYQQLNLLPYRCNYVFWDILVEYNILLKYSIRYNININIIATYLYNNINSYNCMRNSHIGTSNIGTPNIGTSNIGTPNIGNPNIGNPNMGTSHIGTSNIGTPNIGTSNMGTSHTENSNLDYKSLKEYMKLVNTKIKLMNDLLFDALT